MATGPKSSNPDAQSDPHSLPQADSNGPFKPFRVALVGNPNTGKSTLFNALAGLNVRTGNYAGVTIEKKIGRCFVDVEEERRYPVDLIDLPGTYSLAPRSPDELVAVEVLTGDVDGEPDVDLILCVVNATMLRRNLFLVSQLLELGKPIIVVLNMIDASNARGIAIDVDQLSDNLGVPIVATAASRRQGIVELKHEIADHCNKHRWQLEPRHGEQTQAAPVSPLPIEFTEATATILQTLRDQGHADCDLPNPFLIQRALIDGQHSDSGATTAETYLTKQFGAAFADALVQQRQRLVSEPPSRPTGGTANESLAALTAVGSDDAFSAARDSNSSSDRDLIDRECDARYAWAARQLDGVLNRGTAGDGYGWTDRLDGLLTHRVFGLICFVVVMFAIFQSIDTFASTPMDIIDGCTSWVSDAVVSVMPPGMLRSLVTDGIIAGVGGVLIFLPQIVLLFFFLSLLEDCGYMARAAFIVDRIMSAFGLSGKSFLPLMSSFACAVPGVMATRVIESRRERLTTIMVAPLMSCSARLPVYMLLIGAFVPATTWFNGWVSLPAIALMSMYMVGVVVAIPVAWILKKTLLTGDPAPFVLELPEYKWPSLRVVFSRVWQASLAFVLRAGTLIFAASILIWFAGYWPGDHAEQFAMQQQIEAIDIPEETDDEDDALIAQRAEMKALASRLHAEQSMLLENSLLGRTGHAIEPIVRPLGWDWKIGVGALASFPAREVIIATLGTIYKLGGDGDDENSSGLVGAMQASKHPDGSPVYTLPVAFSVMVFFALCAQCVSTLLVIRRETNSWFWPCLSFTYMTVLAYVGAFLTYQVGSRIF